jgi:hypothetical protein
MKTHIVNTKNVAWSYPDDVSFNSDDSRIYNSFKEFFGTTVLTFVTAGAVLSSGALSVKYDLVELTSGRVFAIAMANACVSIFLQLLFVELLIN